MSCSRSRNTAPPNKQSALIQCPTLVPGEGFEPPTFGLQNRCTTTVLTRRGARQRSQIPGTLPVAAPERIVADVSQVIQMSQFCCVIVPRVSPGCPKPAARVAIRGHASVASGKALAVCTPASPVQTPPSRGAVGTLCPQSHRTANTCDAAADGPRSLHPASFTSFSKPGSIQELPPLPPAK